MDELIHALPKMELHLHLEGTLEPEMMFDLAARNHVSLAYANEQQLRQAYRFDNLQSFLDLYYQGMQVLQTEQDFYELTWAYLDRARQQNLVHCELFFDPQAHTDRGIGFDCVINGICRALDKARTEWQLTSRLIMCFLRHLPEQSALQAWQQAQPYLDRIDGVGLDSSERGNPPERFAHVFALAREAGLKCVAHAGEEGPPSYIWQALDTLKVERIDHGVRCTEDPDLVAYLRERQIPLTVCPLSNVRLMVVERLEQHNLRQLLEAGLCATVNSDDPAYFGGYLEDNLLASQQALGLSAPQLVQLCHNSVTACWLDEPDKQMWHRRIDEVARLHAV